MGDFLLILGLIIFVVGMYLLTYTLNKNTEIPQGTIKAECSSCHSPHCSVRDVAGPTDFQECDYDQDNE